MSTILLVDDDPLQAYVRKSLLERRFARVERVSNAADAFILIEDLAFRKDLCLVVSALHLPGLGGQEFVAELITRIPTLPVLVLGRGGEKASDFPGQNVHFLARPISAEVMLDTTAWLLRQYGETSVQPAVA